MSLGGACSPPSRRSASPRPCCPSPSHASARGSPRDSSRQQPHRPRPTFNARRLEELTELEVTLGLHTRKAPDPHHVAPPLAACCCTNPPCDFCQDLEVCPIQWAMEREHLAHPSFRNRSRAKGSRCLRKTPQYEAIAKAVPPDGSPGSKQARHARSLYHAGVVAFHSSNLTGCRDLFDEASEMGHSRPRHFDHCFSIYDVGQGGKAQRLRGSTSNSFADEPRVRPGGQPAARASHPAWRDAL